MRAFVALLLVSGSASADELPTIDSEFPPTLRVSADQWNVRFERIAVAVHSAPETTWVAFSVTGGRRDERVVVALDVPEGTRIIGLGIAGDKNAWGRALPIDVARQRARGADGGALLEWDGSSVGTDHLSLIVNVPSAIEIAMQLPPIPRLAVEGYAGAMIVEVDGEKVVAQKPSRRAIVELLDVAGHVGPSSYPAVSEHVALAAVQSSPFEFLQDDASSRGPHFTRDIDKAIIRRRMKRHQPQLRQCYMAVAQWNPSVSKGGTILSFRIGTDGTVEWAKATESDLPEAVNECLAEEVKKWEFPAPDGSIVVNYPLEFRLND